MSEVHLFTKVLLLEDDSSHALLIRRALKPYVAEVVHVSAVAEVYSYLSKEKVDLVISDLNLPDSQGISHIEQVRNLCRGAPIIVLTSSNSIHDAVAAMRLGARDFIIKNFDDSFSEVLGFSLSRIFSAVQLEQEKRKLQHEMEAFSVAIESSQDGLAVVEKSGEVSYSNSSYRRIVGRFGGSVADLLDGIGPRVARAEALIGNLKHRLESLAVGGVWSTEVSLLDSKDVAFELSISAVRAESSGHACAVVWIRDISERKRREKFQREILSTTTHDLKGPLGTVALCNEMMLDLVEGQDKLKELALRSASCVRGAINLIDEFLSARRIQEGSFILKPAEHDLDELLKGITLDYGAMAAAKRIELTYHCASTEKHGKLDKLGITRVIGNLLSNALKFTPKGGKVGVALRVSDQDIQIDISDNGAGIEPAEVQSLFSRFSRLDQHKGIEGTGLGLFVVKSIVTAHGGKVEVHSQLGAGSTFSVILPKDPPVNERGELVSLDF